jgi:3-oxoacid CoA-transferase subunit A
MTQNKIFLLGDIHGDFQPVRDFCAYMNSIPNVDKRIHEGDTLILLGDVGANFFFNYRDEKLKEKLGKYGLTYFIVRGNHEERPSICYRQNPDKWHMETYFMGSVYVENDYPYIKYAADIPFQYNINGYSCLVLPGAYSIDKYKRLKEGISWFENEQLTPEEMDIGRMIVKACPQWDIVLSHTCPVCYEPTDLFLSAIDQSMVDKSMERYLGEIERELDYKLWCWGHYHATRIYPRFNKSDRVMLFNDTVLDLNKYFETNNPYESLINFPKIID